MTAYIEPGAAMRPNPITMLPHFPAAMLSASLREAVLSTEDAVLVVDDQHRIVLVNHRLERIFGYPATFLLDKPLELLLPSGLPGRVTHAQGSARRDCGRRKALRGRHADGSALMLKSRIARVPLGEEIYLALFLRDAMPADDAAGNLAPALADVVRSRALTTQEASEAEKRRISRKLYDDIGQRLSVLKLDLSWLENSLHGSGRHVPARLAEMQGLLDNVITLTKSMASTLRPPVLDDFGLLPAVEWMLESFRKRTAVQYILEHAGMEERLDDAPASAAFRLIQEALTNIERHAHASHAWVSLRRSRGKLQVRVRDDGIGLEPGNLSKAGCYGLVAMQERIFVLRGKIRIENVRPHGVLIDACIPLEQSFVVDFHQNQTTSLPAHDTNRNRR